MVKAIIFDADHTIYVPRTQQAYEEQFEYLSERLGVSAERLQNIWQAQVDELINTDTPSQRRREVALEKMLKELELPIDQREDIIAGALDRFWGQVIDDIVYDENIDDMFDRLRHKNIDMVAVASDEFREPLEKKLNTVFGDWKKYFDVMITPETAGSMKPSKNFYQRIVEQEGYTPDDVVVVGDSWERDLAPANELGMKTVLLSEVEEGEPDFCIDKLSKLEQILTKL